MSSINKPAQELTFADLRLMYRTGRSIWLSGTGRDKKFAYRHGVMTAFGDMEASEWQTLVQSLIKHNGEDALFAQLREWLKENIPWPQTKEEALEYALELHAGRLFDDPAWVDFIPFNRRYRPEVLETADLVEVRYPCCGAIHETTRVQFLSNIQRYGGQEYCHTCQDWTKPELVTPSKGGE